MSLGEICARCSEFTFEGGKPEEGVGRCIGYGDNTLEPEVRWDHEYCVIFSRAPDMSKRMKWIEARKRLEQEVANAAAAE